MSPRKRPEPADSNQSSAAEQPVLHSYNTRSNAKRQKLNEPVQGEPSALQLEIDMVPEHIETISRFAKGNDVVNVWRPINPETAKKLGGEALYKGKGLNTKGKSSEFGPIAGDIPFDTRLSKVAIDSPDKIELFQKQNQKALDTSEQIYATYRQPGQLTINNYEAFNEQLLVTLIEKQDDQRRTIYYLESGSRNVLFEEGMPVFVVKEGQEHYVAYNYVTKSFDQPFVLPEHHALKSTLIFAYRQIQLTPTNDLQEVRYAVTADYDELVAAARKIYPFLHNTQISTVFTKALYDAMQAQKNIDRVRLIAELIYRHEKEERAALRDVVVPSNQPSMGAVNSWQWAQKVYLKIETAGATNHGPEINNPHPEPLKPGKYPYYLPDGTRGILQDEQEICHFINTQQQAGFPLGVNVKWGWEVDREGNLFIPGRKLDWPGIDEQLNSQYIELSTLEGELEASLNQIGLVYNDANMRLLEEIAQSGIDLREHPKCQQLLIKEGQEINTNLSPAQLDKITKQKTALSERQISFIAEKEIVELLLQLERRKLEPPLIYGEPKKNQRGIFEETMQQQAFRQQVMTQVRILEHDDRQMEIKQIEGLLTNKTTEFRKTFKGQKSIAQEMLDAKKSQEMDSGQSSRSTTSRREMLGKNKAN